MKSEKRMGSRGAIHAEFPQSKTGLVTYSKIVLSPSSGCSNVGKCHPLRQKTVDKAMLLP